MSERRTKAALENWTGLTTRRDEFKERGHGQGGPWFKTPRLRDNFEAKVQAPEATLKQSAMEWGHRHRPHVIPVTRPPPAWTITATSGTTTEKQPQDRRRQDENHHRDLLRAKDQEKTTMTETEEVYVGYVASPESFFLSPRRSVDNMRSSSHMRQVLRSEEKLNKWASEGKLHKVTGLSKLDLVAVNVSGSWRRARVIKEPSDSTCTVPMLLVVDTGDVLKDININFLLQLPEELATNPQHLFFKGRLEGIHPLNKDNLDSNKWSESALKMVRRLVSASHKVFVVQKKDAPRGCGDLLLELSKDHDAEIQKYKKALGGETKIHLTDVLVRAGYATSEAPQKDSMGTASCGTLSNELHKDTAKFHHKQIRRPNHVQDYSRPTSSYTRTSDMNKKSKAKARSRVEEALSTSEGRERERLRLLSGVIDITHKDSINDVAFEPTSTSTPCLSPTPSECSKSDLQEIEPLKIEESAGFLPVQPKEEATGNVTTKLVVHQDPSTRKIKPISNIKDFQWHPELLMYMSNIGISNASRIQTVFWPAVLSHHSVICVGDANAGRSLGYILPLINSLATFDNYPSEPADAPLILVLTLSWKKAESIKYKIMDAVRNGGLRMSGQTKDLDDRERIRCLAVHKDVEREIVVDLANGCQVLVATVPCLLRIIEKGSISLGRCKHVVIEEADEVFERFTEGVRDVMRFVDLKPKDETDWPTQVILNSQRWTAGIQQFVQVYLSQKSSDEAAQAQARSIAGPVVIASGLEMAVYGQVRSKSDLFHHTTDKITALKRIIKKCGGRKVVILCQDFNSGSEISLELQELEVAHLFVHEELPHYSQKSKELILRWRDRVTRTDLRARFAVEVLAAEEAKENQWRFAHHLS